MDVFFCFDVGGLKPANCGCVCVQLVMVLDSWAGELSPASFKEFSEPYLAHIAQKLPQKLQELGLEKVPMTVFPKGAWYALDAACDLGYNVVGMDWLQDPAEAVRIRGDRNVVFQGNADPGVLYGSRAAITKAVEDMVKGFWTEKKKGWIANLGHGRMIYVVARVFYIADPPRFLRYHTGSQPGQPEILL